MDYKPFIRAHADELLGSLSALIERADAMPADEIRVLSERAHRRIREAYSWEFISGRYAQVFLNPNDSETEK